MLPGNLRYLQGYGQTKEVLDFPGQANATQPFQLIKLISQLYYKKLMLLYIIIKFLIYI